jgi:integrase
MRLAIEAIKARRDGSPAAVQTVRRKRAVLYNVLAWAVERGQFSDRPVDAVAWKRPKVSKSVDRRVVVNPGQARELLTTVTYVGGYRRARGRRLWAFFACLYYAGLRPGEALGLRASDCHLPEKGWGSLVVWETRPTAGRRWTDTGQSHDRRGLKNRPQDDIRHVPIPPVLIRSLRAHLNEFGTSVDGRLFTNERGGIPGASTYSRVWTEARLLALTPDQVASPMAARPYDLRHAALSTWLNSGVDPTEVAERAGNSS